MNPMVQRRLGAGLMAAALILAWDVAGVAVTVIALLVAVLLSAGLRPARDQLARRARARPGATQVLMLPAAGLWALALAAALLAPGLGGRASLLAEIRFGLTVPASEQGTIWHLAIDLLAGTALVGSLLVARALRRPGVITGVSYDAALTSARRIVAEYGDDSLAPYVLRPDKQYELAPDGLVAFTVVADTVVISADPVGSPEGAGAALEALVGRARRAGLRVVGYGASARHLDAFTRLGLHAVRCGEEAFLDPAGFTLAGRSVRKLRQSANRIERRGWEIRALEGREISGAVEQEISRIDATWSAAQPRLLGWAMSMGVHEPPIRPDDLYLLARSPSGELSSYVRFLAHRDKLSLDVMRRTGETPNGLNDALVARALEYARDSAVSEVSLNYAGLSHLLRPGAPAGRLNPALARRLLAPLRGRFQMDRLVRFNHKFSPQWRPRYILVSSPLALPHAVWRVLQVEGILGSRTQPSEPLTGQPRLSSAPVPGELGR